MPSSKSSQPQTPPPIPRDPEYVAIILAATQGARLFPLTSEYPHGVPKHLLPISPLSGGGDDDGACPLLQRLLVKTYESGFEMVVVAIHNEDSMTVPFLLGTQKNDTKTGSLCKALSKENAPLVPNMSYGEDVTDLEYHGKGCSNSPSSSKRSNKTKEQRWMHVRVVRLPEECHGSADALRFLSSSGDGSTDDERNESSSSPAPHSNSNASEDICNKVEKRDCYIPSTSHAVVMPGDLIVEGGLLSSNDKTNYDGNDVFSLLVQAHRRWNAHGPSEPTAACTMLLTDVGAEDDKEGIPLKESSKAKMGLFSREEEDMEYIGLSSEVPPPLSGSLASLKHSQSTDDAPSQRVVLKRSKLEVEEDEGTGSTPKLAVAKRRLHAVGGKSKPRIGAGFGGGGLLSMTSTAAFDKSPTISLRTDLHDVHVYAISNWVFQLLHARPSMQSFQEEVLPLLISRQHRGVEAAFGPTAWKKEENRERLRNVLKELDGLTMENRKGVVDCNKVSALLGMYASGKMSGGLGSFIPDEDDVPNPANEDEDLDPNTPKASSSSAPPSSDDFPKSKHSFAVSAQVLSREASTLTLRACTLPSLLYGCSAISSQTLKLDPAHSSALVPKNSKLSTKFNSIVLPNCSMGEKVQTKSSTISHGVTVGDRAKLNNVVVMEGASIGSNTVLQNSLVGKGANIGENCNLKDCQVGPGAVVPSGTRTVEKGEAFHV